MIPLLAQAVFTAYCSCVLCCGTGAVNKTAAGTRPVQGVTIAGPRSIPLGTKVDVRLPSGWHRFVVEDRTARRFDGRFDIYFESHKAAKVFGRKQLEYRILP